MQPHCKWLAIAAIFAGFLIPAVAFPAVSLQPAVPEVAATHGEICPSARTTVFDARQFVRGAIDDAHWTPCLSPELEPATLSFATAAPFWASDHPAAPQTLVALHVRLQP